jgi:hypothetical protein
MRLQISLLAGRFAVCRMGPDAAIPANLLQVHPGFLSITRTADELSVVCPEELAPAGAKAQPGWCAFKVEGPLDFSLTGVMATLATPLATAKISLFAVATFDTDYLLVQERDLEAAIAALSQVSEIRC